MFQGYVGDILDINIYIFFELLLNLYAIILVIFFSSISTIFNPHCFWCSEYFPGHSCSFQIMIFFKSKTFFQHQNCGLLANFCFTWKIAMVPTGPQTRNPRSPGSQVMKWPHDKPRVAAFGLGRPPQKKTRQKTIICKTYHHQLMCCRKKNPQIFGFFVGF